MNNLFLTTEKEIYAKPFYERNTSNKLSPDFISINREGKKVNYYVNRETGEITKIGFDVQERAMFYKILKNNEIIDIQNKLIYVRKSRSGTIVCCSLSNANGIALEDGIYHLNGLPEFPLGTYETVEANEITKNEYIELAQQLGIDVPEAIPTQEERITALEDAMLEVALNG